MDEKLYGISLVEDDIDREQIKKLKRGIECAIDYMSALKYQKGEIYDFDGKIKYLSSLLYIK